MKRWQAIPPGETAWRSFDDEHVLYHIPSGNTHLLGAAAADIFFYLQQSPASLPEIAQFLAAKMQLETDQDLLDRIAEILSELRASALIRQVECQE